ncbi:MAG: hypothetical protein EB117_15130 [Betaproteobacteria bacterium]|nr:hypothetical protein [Betaproteobacteria bacterium]
MTFEDAIDMGTIPAGMTREQWNAVYSISPTTPGIVAANQVPGENWWETGQKILTSLVMTEQQRQLMQLNIERAKLGQPPIDINRYTGVGVNVGLSQGTQTLVTYVAIGAGLLLLFNALRR